METLYITCALVGGVFLVCQFLLTVLGFGDHHGDVSGHDSVGHDGVDHDSDLGSGAQWFVGVLTFRTVIAALTFFGLTGLAGTLNGWEPGLTLLVAAAAGGGALFLVGWLMRSLHRLNADGTARIDRAVGVNGTVYLTIPGHKAGTGKVHVQVQNRTMEYQAITGSDALPTGSRVVVVAVLSPDTVEVAPLSDLEKTAHA